MAEDGITTEPGASEGTTGSGSEGTTAPDPGTSDGQSAAGTSPDGQATAPDSGTTEETFFDPKSIEGKPELQAAFKQMQGVFTKKMQGISDVRKKAEAFEAFQQNPMQALERMARQMGQRPRLRAGCRSWRACPASVPPATR